MGSRERMDEFLLSVRAATPEMRALGAETKEIYDTLAQIAVGSRRQVIARAEDLRQIFSVSQLLGKSTNEIVEAFGRVGYDYQQISKNVLDSIRQIQSFGLNARTVMEEVYKNTDQLSRFSFENGVEGLTRMAAQASMLRFDMKETFELAEEVLDPDRAVSVASAFQRLGVSAGNLVDPMALLNQSLTDPTGLQNSLINVARQFTYFNEETNSFRINPQGILTLKEIESQTGVSAKTMREAALAAADLDRRLAEINKSEISFGMDESDKTLLANISRYGAKGSIEVKVSRPGEVEAFRELSTLTKEEKDRIIQEQKRTPQTIEELQKAQLTTGEKSLAELRRLNAIIAGGVINAPGFLGPLQESVMSMRKGLDMLPTSVLTDFQDKMDVFYQKLEKPGITEKEKKAIYREIQGTLESGFFEMFSNLGQTIGETMEGTFADDFFKSFMEAFPKDFNLPTGTNVKVSGSGVIIPGSTTTQPEKKYKPIYGPSSSVSPMGRGFIMPGMPGASIQINVPKVEQINNINGPKFGVEVSPQELMAIFKKGGSTISEDMARSIYDSLKKLGFETTSPANA